MEENSFEFKVNLDVKDYQEFNFWHLFHGSNPILLFISCAVIIICLPVLLLFYIKEGDMFPLIIFILGCVFLLALLVFFPLTIRLASKSAYASDKFLQEEQTFKLDNEQIEVSSPSSNARTAWSEVHRMAESKGHFFIYVAKTKAFIIPKRQIDSSCMEFLRSKMKARGSK